MVDALVSGASAARRAGSSPVLGTIGSIYATPFLTLTVKHISSMKTILTIILTSFFGLWCFIVLIVPDQQKISPNSLPAIHYL